MIYEIIMGLVKNPQFNIDVVSIAHCFDTEINDEFAFELIDKASIIYEFNTSMMEV